MKTPLQATILYDAIAEHKAGVYVYANLDDRSALTILELIKTCPGTRMTATDLHCTIMHCMGDIPSMIAEVPDDHVMEAQIEGITEWIDHKKRRIWVLALVSQDLRAVHDSLVAQGIKHSFADYNPHIRIAKDIPDSADARTWYMEANDFLFKYKPRIRFDGILKAAPCK